MSASLHVRTYDLLLENITYLIIIFSLWRTDMALLLLSLDQMSNIWSYVWTFELYIWKKNYEQILLIDFWGEHWRSNELHCNLLQLWMAVFQWKILTIFYKLIILCY